MPHLTKWHVKLHNTVPITRCVHRMYWYWISNVQGSYNTWYIRLASGCVTAVCWRSVCFVVSVADADHSGAVCDGAALVPAVLLHREHAGTTCGQIRHILVRSWARWNGLLGTTNVLISELLFVEVLHLLVWLRCVESYIQGWGTPSSWRALGARLLKCSDHAVSGKLCCMFLSLLVTKLRQNTNKTPCDLNSSKCV